MNKKQILKWNIVGQRATFGSKMIDLVDVNDNIMVITADVAIPAGLDKFRKVKEDNYIDVGIAEQNMMGVAAGLSNEGYKVFTTTYAPFQTMRALEQIRTTMGDMQHDICMVGLSSGVALGMIGNMHCSFEDISVIRSIPNITIVSPADSFELIKALEKIVYYEKPLYLRLTGNAGLKSVHTADFDFEIGKAITLKKGKDIAIIGTGTIVADLLEVAQLFEDKGISVSVINMHTIRPLDTNILDEVNVSHSMLVTVEEHVVHGGLSGAIAEYNSNKKKCIPQISIGLPSDYSKAGEYNIMLDYYGLSKDKIYTKIRDEYEKLLEEQ